MVSISEVPVESCPQLPLDDRFGADQQFLGVVRGLENGRRILGIRYSCYETMALRMLQEIAETAEKQKPVEHRVRIHHRTGFVPAGEASVVIQVQAKHSREAFELCQEYLRRVKTEVPIWKEPVYAAGE